jgi:hypothetical protein
MTNDYAPLRLSRVDALGLSRQAVDNALQRIAGPEGAEPSAAARRSARDGLRVRPNL